MVVNLEGKSIDDLVKIPLVLGDERLIISPNKRNEVYVYEGKLVHYTLESSRLKVTPWSVGDIFNHLAIFQSQNHYFLNNLEEQELLKYFAVTIWDKFPKKFRDVTLYHEFVELTFPRGKPEQSFHDVAVERTEEYIQKYFSPEEIRKYYLMMERLSSLIKKRQAIVEK